MDAFGEVEDIFATALGHAPFHAALGPVVRHWSPAPPRCSARVSEGWPECLSCGLVWASSFQRGRHRGLCEGCYVQATPTERRWYRWMVERWRKWSLRRFNARVFRHGPDPWQVTLYTLGKAMLGFATAPGHEGTARAGLDEQLGVPAQELRAICRGDQALSADARRLLVARGEALFQLWKDDDRDDGEGSDVAEDEAC